MYNIVYDYNKVVVSSQIFMKGTNLQMHFVDNGVGSKFKNNFLSKLCC